MRKKILLLSIISSFVFTGCDDTKTPEETTDVSTEKVGPADNEESETSFYGTFTLTEMNTVTGDKELTEQDIAYITESKERTLGKTTLSLNEDETFIREFPHPSGDGSIKT